MFSRLSSNLPEIPRIFYSEKGHQLSLPSTSIPQATIHEGNAITFKRGRRGGLYREFPFPSFSLTFLFRKLSPPSLPICQSNPNCLEMSFGRPFALTPDSAAEEETEKDSSTWLSTATPLLFARIFIPD